MKVIADYTEVYRIDKDGNSTFYCWFLNPDGVETQLAMLLCQLRGQQWWPHRTITGETKDPLKEAKEEIKLITVDPKPVACFGYGGDYYFGYVREYREIDDKEYNKHPQQTQKQPK